MTLEVIAAARGDLRHLPVEESHADAALLAGTPDGRTVTVGEIKRLLDRDGLPRRLAAYGIE